MTTDEIRYALAKQLPSAEHSLIIHTNYGGILLIGEAAQAVVNAATQALKKELASHE